MDEPGPETAAGEERPPARPAGRPIGRRVVLGMLGLGAVGIVAGARIEDVLSSAFGPILAKDPTGLGSLLPIAGSWRIYTVTGSLPLESDAAWRLEVDGLVERPLMLDYDQLRSLPATRLIKDFQCVTGWRVEHVHWVGVRLGDLLDRVGVKPAARALVLTSFDGAYTESLTLDQARRPDVIVAYGMEDGPISRDHGGPVRLYVAPMYGYKSCKWLQRISVVDRVIPGYWEQRGYDIDGWVGRSNGRDDPPTG